MSFDFSQLAGLAAALEKVGAPILAAALRAAAPIVGTAIPIPGASLIIPPILNALADALGGSADDVDSLASKINSDPTAADKVQAIEASKADDLKSLLDLAQVQADQNKSYETVTAENWRELVLRFFFVGWRPAAGWVFSLGLAAVLIATWRGWTPPDTFDRYFNGASTIFMALIAARTGDKIFGVATNSLKQVAASGATIVSQAVRKINKR